VGTVVDVHTHFIPNEFVDRVAAGDGPTGVSVERRAGREPLVVHDNGLRYPVFDVFSDTQSKLHDMDERGIDVSVVSISPSLFFYWLEPRETARVCRVVNEAAAAMARESGGRIRAMATVPMNDPEAAAAELRHAHGELGLTGVEIGTSVGARQLDSPSLDVFFATAAELKAPVMLHPYVSMVTAPEPGLEGFHLANVIGNPVETFTAACRLIVGGVLDRHPELRVLLVHGGGAFPYQLGRLQHAHAVREETRSVAQRAPLEYLGNFLFDTVAYDSRALGYLIELADGGNVLFGSDLPFDMADLSPLAWSATADPGVAEQVLGANAIREYSIDTAQAAAVTS
jgi:aminocarboxymuconate-semialdehyde decarboxylase